MNVDRHMLSASREAYMDEGRDVTAADKWMIDNYERGTSFVYELSDAVELVQAGVEACRRVGTSADSRIVSVVLLANGFERLLQCALAMAFLRDKERLPEKGEFKGSHGHDLMKLWQRLARQKEHTSSDVADILVRGATEGTLEHRVLAALDDQVKSDGRFLHQSIYLGVSVKGTATPENRLATEELIVLYLRGQLHDHVEAGGGRSDAWLSARDEIIAVIRCLAGVVAAMFEDGALGTIARDLAPFLAPLGRASTG
jgi:hypothetical protein